ncbi:vWA domain-containing protein, partial [Photobacterium carnosum]
SSDDNSDSDSSDDNSDSDSSDDNSDSDSSDDNSDSDSSDDNSDSDSSDDNSDSDSSDDNSDSDSSDDNSDSDSSDDNSDSDSSDDNSDSNSSDDNSDSNSSDDNSDSNSSDDNSDSDSSDDNSDGKSSQSSDTDSSQSSDNDSQEPSNQATAQDIIDALNAGDGDLIGDLHEEIEELLKEKAIEVEDEFKDKNGKYTTPSFALGVCKERCFIGVPSWIKDADPVTQRMRQVLNSIVYSRNKTERSYERTGNTIATGELWGASCGNSRIFQVETTHRAPNAAFQILVDKSGSMDGYAMQLANIAAFSIASAIEFIRGAECEVLYYPVGGSSGLKVHVAKSFKEKISSCRNKSFNVMANYGTPTAEALLTALSRIGVRKEPKKVIFLITDGDACDANIYDVLNDCDAANVDVIGVGIGLNNLAGFENRPYVSINDASELAPQLFSYIRNVYQK